MAPRRKWTTCCKIFRYGSVPMCRTTCSEFGLPPEREMNPRPRLRSKPHAPMAGRSSAMRTQRERKEGVFCNGFPRYDWRNDGGEGR